MLKFVRSASAKECKSCRFRKILQNAPTLAIVAVDTDENELSKVSQVTNRSRRNIGMGGTSLEWSQEAGPTKSDNPDDSPKFADILTQKLLPLTPPPSRIQTKVAGGKHLFRSSCLNYLGRKRESGVIRTFARPRYLVGTEQGAVLSLNKKPKKAPAAGIAI